MKPEALETFYETLARAIDAVGPARESLFLARLALLLAEATGDGEAATCRIAMALEGLAEEE